MTRDFSGKGVVVDLKTHIPRAVTSFNEYIILDIISSDMRYFGHTLTTFFFALKQNPSTTEI